MKHVPNNNFLTLLMIGSYLVLTLFVIQWIRSQYTNEKSELNKQLSQQFENTQQEVVDAMLEKNLIDPLLKNKDGFKIHIIEDTIQTMVFKGVKNDSIHTIIRRNSIHDTGSVQLNIEEEVSADSDTSNDLLMHGVKLIFKEVAGAKGKEFEHRFYSSIDTSILNNHLHDRFRKNEWNFNMKWIGAKDTSGFSKKENMLYYKSNLFPVSYFLEISDFKKYLFLKIFPQGIFALILLLLTGFAFYISNRALKNQIKLNLLKNELIDNISHELKTPLTTVKVVIDALQDDAIRQDQKKTKEYLEMASLEIDRLELLTGKVLNTSMMENGMVQLQKEEIDLVSMIKNLINILDIRLKKMNAIIEVDDDGNNYKISGDRFHLEGVFLNIIDNGLKYSGTNPVLKIKLLKDENHIIVKIIDNGPGIPKEYQSKIFNKFFRVPSGNLHNVKGHGLGLSYVSMVMKLHEGKVYAENENGGGTVFNLVFPAVRV